MKAVMYHYVREYDNKYPNFRFLDINQFKKQLDYFEQNFGFLDKEEWNHFINEGKIPSNKGKVLLTFDDALHCQYEYVFPELIRRGLWGIFYVPTLPYIKKTILDVHKIHLLCGAFEAKSLLAFTSKLITEDMIPDKKRKEFREKTYLNQKNFQAVSEFKRLLNYFIEYKYRSFLIEEIRKEFSYQFDYPSFYISYENLVNMKNQGMIIGSHTESHLVMSKLSKEEQFNQVKNSFDFLSELSDENNKTYSHPYGGFHSFNNSTIQVLSENNVRYSFNVESREIDHKDYQNSMSHLPRFDCNEFAFGKAS